MAPKLTIEKRFFETHADVMEDIKASGFWPATYVSAPSAALPTHWHDVDVNGYVMEGTTWMRDGDTGEKIPVEPGDKLIIPAGALHAEGEVLDTVTYIIATSEPGALPALLTMREPGDPERTHG